MRCSGRLPLCQQDLRYLRRGLREAPLGSDDAEVELYLAAFTQVHGCGDPVRGARAATTLANVPRGALGAIDGDGELWAVAVSAAILLVASSPFHIRRAPHGESS